MCRGCSPDTSKMTRRTRAPQITSREEQEASVCGVRREKQETREAQERDTRERHKRERRERRETQETRKTRSTGRDLLVHGLQAFRMLIDLKLHRTLSLCRGALSWMQGRSNRKFRYLAAYTQFPGLPRNPNFQVLIDLKLTTVLSHGHVSWKLQVGRLKSIGRGARQAHVWLPWH